MPVWLGRKPRGGVSFGGLTLGAGGGGGAAPTLLPVHARTIPFGDGIISFAAAPSNRNMVDLAYMFCGQRVRQAAGGNLGTSGTNLDDHLALVPRIILLNPQIVIFHGGHNSSLLGGGYATAMPKWLQIYTDLRAGLPDAHLIFTTTLPSTSEAEPNRAAVWAAQLAIDGADGGKTHVADIANGFDPATMCWDSVHTNRAGAYHAGLIIAAKINSIVTAPVGDEILDQITASGEYGANLDPDYALSGTTGTETGTNPPTGDTPTGRTSSNSTAGITVTTAVAGGVHTITITGTASAEGNVNAEDSGNLALTGSQPGDFYEQLMGVVIDDGAGGAPTGVRQYGSSLAGNNLGLFMGTPSSDASDPGLITYPVNGIWRAQPKVVQTAASTSKAIMHVRVKNGVSLGSGIRFATRKPIYRKTELVAYAAPHYVGDLYEAAQQQRATGTGVVGTTVTAATVGTMTFMPGRWSGGALDFSTRSLLKNGVLVSGALASAWTYNAAGQVTAGDTLTFRVQPSNSFGSDSRDVVFTVV